MHRITTLDAAQPLRGLGFASRAVSRANVRRRGFVLACTLIVAVACGGCSLFEGRSQRQEPMRIHSQKMVVGHSVEGNPIELEVLGTGGDVVLLMASIHGNEPAGTPLLGRLRQYIDQHPDLLEGRKVLLMPVANPDGLARNIRHNVRGVDINRNFPAGNFQETRRHGPAALSEPESQAIHDVLTRFTLNRIVSIHQPLECVDWDGPGESLARAMGAWTDLPVKKLGGRPGSLGSYAGDTLGIPIITLELPKHATGMDEDALWQAYGPMMLAAIRFPDELSPAEVRLARGRAD
jgi:murein peptide amidase A